MNTNGFTIIDKLISSYRLLVALRYVEKEDVILDLGCGYQHYLLRCTNQKFKFGYGLDYEVPDIKKDNIILKNYKYEGRLPLEDNYFDKIFLLAVLEHVEEENVPKLFSEFSRILKDNGSVIVTTPTPKSQKILEIIALKLKLVAAEEVVDHKHYYVHDEIFKLAKTNGLGVADYKLFQFGLNSLYILRKQGKGS